MAPIEKKTNSPALCRYLRGKKVPSLSFYGLFIFSMHSALKNGKIAKKICTMYDIGFPPFFSVLIYYQIWSCPPPYFKVKSFLPTFSFLILTHFGKYGLRWLQLCCCCAVHASKSGSGFGPHRRQTPGSQPQFRNQQRRMMFLYTVSMLAYRAPLLIR